MEPNEQQIKTEVSEAIARIREKEKEKSFSGRHPELGKMINCRICDRRHRSSITCVQVFAKNEKGVELIAEGPGHGKGRINRHWNKRSLQVVDLTRRLLPFYPVDQSGTPEDIAEAQALAVKKARSKAINQLRKVWHAESNRIQRRQKLSRAINRG